MTASRSVSSSSSSLPINIKTNSKGVLPAASLAMNVKGDASESLYYICLTLLKRLEKVPGMDTYMVFARSTAELSVEQQSLALDQLEESFRHFQGNNTNVNNNVNTNTNVNVNVNNDNGNSSRSSMRKSYNSLSFGGSSTVASNTWSPQTPLSSNSNSNSNSSDAFAATSTNLYTFAAGRLPTKVSFDPVTVVWKLFQQGAPLCVIFNSLNLNNAGKIEIFTSTDLRICKKSVYDFLYYCKTHLKTVDDKLFTISDVYSDSTNDLLKVIKAVNLVLDLKYPKISQIYELETPDSRSKVIKEIVESERTYVQHLEILLQFKYELEKAELVSPEAIHILFPNLTEIVDFQRKFLVGLELNAKVSESYQRIGSVFLHAISFPFKAYEAWPVGLNAANELIVQEVNNLRRSSTLISVPDELQYFLIKPIQRVCKYHLLLSDLVKYSDSTCLNYNELIKALKAAKNFANNINEVQRRAENVNHFKYLLDNVRDWRGYSPSNFGDLLFHGTLGVTDTRPEREFKAYLFEKIIFFFSEIIPPTKKNILDIRKKSTSSLNNNNNNGGSSNASLNNNNNSINSNGIGNGIGNNNNNNNIKPYQLELKGRIFIANIDNLTTSNKKDGVTGHYLTISWTGSKDTGVFILRFQSEESRSQWENCLRNLTEELNSSLSRRNSEFDTYSPLSNNASARTSFNSYQEEFINAAPRTASIGSASKLPSNTTNTVGTNNNGFRRASDHHITEYNNGHNYGSLGGNSSSSGAGGPPEKFRSFSTPNAYNNRTSSSINSIITPMNGLSMTSSPASSNSDEDVKVRILYGNESFHISVVKNSSYSMMRALVFLKLERSIPEFAVTVNTKLKYKDDDGDYIDLAGDEDWTMAKDFWLDMDEEERLLTILVKEEVH
ncbi:hypothetical protein PACTADRAFT_49926 [Pachysolen tannophilus NRRL Y-2460]|uniref:DH domain-containing protein n=1 Tax=Pachysolen tannophilus NRRL Y-2460 TaxID=669874 RepID=A0A1E4TU29_PACTA|nr:hypothetical protein PACTADRAFT_49926 [Pachysolen tannophilus NRRL Y-2460]